jgi:hypothetical protein
VSVPSEPVPVPEIVRSAVDHFERVWNAGEISSH